MIPALLLGLSYGFAAGVSPRPTTGLIIAQTLRRGWRAGNLVALAPLFTDLPIILVAVLLIGQLPRGAFGWLGIAGGLFVLYLAVETIRTARVAGATLVAVGPATVAERPLAALWHGIATNALNPHPYLFWGTVGAQLILRGFERGGAGAVAAFLIGFYALLVGVKLLLALMVNYGRNWLRGPAYGRVIVASGVLLVGLGLLLTWDGVGTLLANM
jgi:threonine/homoserine/homoserine lactone efflux protein